MKWRIGSNNNISKQIFRNLKRSVNEGCFSHNIIDSLDRAESDFEITLSSDNQTYIENMVDNFVSMCYSKNFIFDIAEDNQKLIYTRHSKSKDKNSWYFSLNKITLSDGYGLSYHIHFSKNKKNFHILLNYDTNII